MACEKALIASRILEVALTSCRHLENLGMNADIGESVLVN